MEVCVSARIEREREYWCGYRWNALPKPPKPFSAADKHFIVRRQSFHRVTIKPLSAFDKGFLPVPARKAWDLCEPQASKALSETV
uniref:Uncharacterized protein n=1 Tax=Candidatus Kentrum sp. MB TaxID=2138164 RepID=A0A450Y3I9_9GAMM|nr:MAG: hypothetical protein BECKMB1821I_GA0114274_12012 [Candidatus Kentron sp. MB]VFK77651.1 MAG: hypothetical protein BECKMB1821H_GA0114242_12002 [Candidatus Kentron sp. MB]